MGKKGDTLRADAKTPNLKGKAVLNDDDYDDWLIGHDGANVLDGLGGNDDLSGHGGNDFLYGGFGKDWMEGGTGDDVLRPGEIGGNWVDGGADIDTVSYVQETLAVTIDLGAIGAKAIYSRDLGLGANAPSDRLLSIENIVGGLKADSLTGSDVANEISGMDGNDTIAGGGGNDTLRGNDGNDSLSGGDNSDVLSGGDGNDTLNGGDGNDTLRADGGSDEVSGGAGIDTADYGDVDLRMTVNLDNSLDGSGTARGVRGAPRKVDILSGIENVTTGGRDDVVFGSAQSNLISTGGGIDKLSGGGDADILYAGADNDELFGDGGADILFGQLGQDTLTGGQGIDAFLFEQVADSKFSVEDTIADFNGELIDLSGLVREKVLPLEWIGDKQFTKSATMQVRYDAGGILQVDVTGNQKYGAGDFGVKLTGAPALTEANLRLNANPLPALTDLLKALGQPVAIADPINPPGTSPPDTVAGGNPPLPPIGVPPVPPPGDTVAGGGDPGGVPPGGVPGGGGSPGLGLPPAGTITISAVPLLPPGDYPVSVIPFGVGVLFTLRPEGGATITLAGPGDPSATIFLNGTGMPLTGVGIPIGLSVSFEQRPDGTITITAGSADLLSVIFEAIDLTGEEHDGSETPPRADDRDTIVGGDGDDVLTGMPGDVIIIAAPVDHADPADVSPVTIDRSAELSLPLDLAMATAVGLDPLWA